MRLAIISDIHEDIVNLEEAFRKIEKYKVDEMVCLGDISGFSMPYYTYFKTRDASACLNHIRNKCSTIVLGNHDIHAGKIVPNNKPFPEFNEDWYTLDYKQRKVRANNKIWLHEENDLNTLYAEEEVEYLRMQKEVAVKGTKNLNLLFSHYVLPNVTGLIKSFYTYADEFKHHFEYMNQNNCQISFVGHSHIKGCFVATTKKFNQRGYKSFSVKNTPVCIGIPPLTSHGKRSGFCIFDTDNMQVQIVRF